MPFDFYERLGRAQQSTYRKSDAVASIGVPDIAALAGALSRLREGLDTDARVEVAAATAELLGLLCAQLRVRAAEVEVLARRPSSECRWRTA